MYALFAVVRKELFICWKDITDRDVQEVNKLPSEKILQQKKEIVAKLSEQLKNSVAGVVVDYKGITVADDTKLRKRAA